MPAAENQGKTGMRKTGWILAITTTTFLFAYHSRLYSQQTVEETQELEPKVSIEEHHNRTVEEYRVNNNLYMVKVRPRVGRPYYLVDHDGSGSMEWSRGSSELEKQAPRWTLFSW
jgi:hypothetical protein